MWIDPKGVVKHVTETPHPKSFWLLAFIYGLNAMLAYAPFFLSDFSLWGKVGISVVLGAPLGYIALSIFSLFLYWSGKLIKGAGSFVNLRTATAWSTVTLFVNLIVWVVYIVGFSDLMAGSRASELTGAPAIVLMLCNWGVLVAAIWGIVLLCKGVGQVQGFSSWLGLLNVVFASIGTSVIYVIVYKLIQYALNPA